MNQPSVPGLIPTFALISVLDVVARIGGIGRALRFANRLAGFHATSSSAPSERTFEANETTDAITRRVVMAAAFYPRRALCLEQSLALYVLLRRRGIDAALRLGVQTIPFSAHAWVEVNGVPVNEKQGHIEQLSIFQQAGI